MAVNQAIYEGQLSSMEVDQTLPSSPLPRLTAQERMFVAAINAGASVAEASRRAGISENTGRKWRDREDILMARDHYLREFERDVLPNVRFTKDDAHHMYMEAYRNSANATEQIKATDSLVKLHDLNAKQERPEEKEINSTKQLEKMSVQELLKLAEWKMNSLTPDDIAEGDFQDV